MLIVCMTASLPARQKFVMLHELSTYINCTVPRNHYSMRFRLAHSQ